MVARHIVSEIEPGLSLIQFETEVSREIVIKRRQAACAVFTIVVDGAINFRAPVAGAAIADSVLLSASSVDFEIEATIPPCQVLRSVDLMLDPSRLAAGASSIGAASEIKRLCQSLESARCFRILKQSEVMRGLATEVLDAADGDTTVLSDLRRRSVAYEMLYELAKALTHQDDTPEDLSERDVLSDVYSVLQASPERYETVDALAADFGLSGRALSRTFSHRYGMSAAKAMRRFRLERAHRMIERGKPVSVAGYEAGYTNASSFSSAFSSHFGYAPRCVKRAGSSGYRTH